MDRFIPLKMSLFLLTFPTFAFATENASTFETCLHQEKSELAIKKCSARELSRLNTKLQNSYNELLSILDTERRQKYINSQRAWHHFVSLDCDLLNEGFPEQILGSSLCQFAHMKQRIEDIDFRLCNEPRGE